MADYIDRQAAIAALRGFAEECKGRVLDWIGVPWEDEYIDWGRNRPAFLKRRTYEKIGTGKGTGEPAG